MAGKGRAPKKRRARKGTGSIYEYRPGRFRGQIDLGLDADGNRVRPSFTGSTHREVQDQMDAAKRAFEEGMTFDADKITVAQHIEDFLRAKKPDLEPATYRKYKYYYSKIRPVLGGLRVKNLSYQRLNIFWEHLDEQGLGRNTVAGIASFLRSCLNDAVAKKILSHNPAQLAAKRTPKYDEARFLNQEEIAAFFEAAKGERLEDLFIVALHTGLRPGELFGLPWNRINLEQKTLKVRQALHEQDGKLHIGDVKTSAARRTVSLSAAAIAALRRQRKRQLQERLLLGEDWQDTHNLVFTNTLGGFLRRTSVGKKPYEPKGKGKRRVHAGPLHRIAGKAGIEGITLHTFRHTHASLLIFAGVDIKTVSRRLGHENIRITLQTYGHLLPGQDERAAEAMDHLMADIGTQ